jgi:hypothetical protein
MLFVSALILWFILVVHGMEDWAPMIYKTCWLVPCSQYVRLPHAEHRPQPSNGKGLLADMSAPPHSPLWAVHTFTRVIGITTEPQPLSPSSPLLHDLVQHHPPQLCRILPSESFTLNNPLPLAPQSSVHPTPSTTTLVNSHPPGGEAGAAGGGGAPCALLRMAMRRGVSVGASPAPRPCGGRYETVL